ncbi:MAG: SRPBCC family protein [Chloroflexota bacterium]
MKLARSITINVPAEKAWHIVAHDFANIGDWSSGVAKSENNVKAHVPDEATVGGRVCTVPGFGQIRETFTQYDARNMRFTYEAKGMPFFVKSAHNSWKIEAVDANTSRASFQVEMILLPVIGAVMSIPMRIQLTSLLDDIVEELKYFAETGTVHPRKQKLIAKTNRVATTS